MFSLFWHFWFTTWAITRLLWIAGHTFPVQRFSFHQLNCRRVLWRICFLSIKLRMLYQTAMSCLFLTRSPFFRVKSCRDEVWSWLPSSSVITSASAMLFCYWEELVSSYSFTKAGRSTVSLLPFPHRGVCFCVFPWEIIHSGRLNPRVGKFSKSGVLLLWRWDGSRWMDVSPLLGHVCEGGPWNAALVAPPVLGTRCWVCF